MTSGMPLPGFTVGGPVPSPPGLWRGTVEDLAPLTISISRLTGVTAMIPNCEQAVITPALGVGDRVWVAPIEGNHDAWCVLARRA